MRFLADAGISPSTVEFLQSLGHHAEHVSASETTDFAFALTAVWSPRTAAPCRRRATCCVLSSARMCGPADSDGSPERKADSVRLDRITVDPAVCTGKPCIRGLRFPVSRLLGLLAAGEPRDAILRAYPYLEPQDIDAALQYAAALAEDETIELSR